MTKHIILDFDGTIANSITYNLNIINKLSKKFGHKGLTKSELRNLSHKSMKEVIKEFKIPLYKLPFIVWAAKKESKKDYVMNIKPFPGIISVLKNLKNRGYLLDILSSAHKETIFGFLVEYKLNFFENIVSDVSIFSKGKRINKFLRKIKHKDAIYIGDEVRDIAAAKKAGIKIISVTWGFNSEETLKRENPDYIVRKPKDILRILK
jgi:phosphoglycolate phosphatase-like HAD superfamily hydrolase